jgi:hypothetical protein
MASDFGEIPPSRRVQRPEYEGLSGEQVRDLEAKRLIGLTKKEPPPRQWLPAERSHAGILALLSYPHDPRTGVPLQPVRPADEPPPPKHATDAELAAAAGRHFRRWAEFEEADRRYWQNYLFWVGLDRAQKSQLCCDVQFGGEDVPEWDVCHTRDGDFPNLRLRAASEHQAVARFQSVCGIIGIDREPGGDYESPIVATRVEPPAV